MRFFPLFILLLASLVDLSCATRVAVVSDDGNWVNLGQRTVNHAVDRDEIPVGVRDGSFRRIKLVVRNRAVTFREVRIHYANGGVQEVDLRRQIPAGGQSRAIDLTGQDRVISRVVFFYNTSARRGRRAVVQLMGLR